MITVADVLPVKAVHPVGLLPFAGGHDARRVPWWSLFTLGVGLVLTVVWCVALTWKATQLIEALLT